MSRQFFTSSFYNENKATDRYEFDIQNVDLSVINGIRRTILADIPILGFMGEGADISITIHKNSGPLHNEIMLHRIGMIPLHLSEENIENFVEDSLEFTLTSKNKDVALLNVTTKDLEGKLNGVKLTERELRNIFPANAVTKDYVLITRLRQGEELNFSAKVVKKTAKDHAAFSTVSLCAFNYNEDLSKTTEMTNILEKERTYLKNTFGDPTSIHFAIEPETGLSPKYIVSKAIKILIEKLKTVRNELDKLSDSTLLSIVANTKIDDTFDLNINNEDDTLGNLFQSIIYNHFIRTNASVLNDKYTMSYVGYYAPHPLDKKIVIRMTLKGDDVEEKDYIAVLKECLGIIENTLNDVFDDWMIFMS